MADDSAAGSDVPGPVREWLAGLAEGGDAEAVDLAQLFSGDGDAVELSTRIEELERSVEGLDADLEEMIQDVRERVIQVKRESDAKAPAEHEHDALTEAVARLQGHLEALATDFVDLDASVDDLDERVDAVDDRVSAGFSNFEDVLTYLVDTTDELGDAMEILVRATLSLQERTDRLAVAEARRAAADDLRESANRFGVSEAKCEECGGSVDLSLLTESACPHCSSLFTDFEPRRGFFRSSLLHTGERPALEGEVEGAQPDLERLVHEGVPTPPSFDGVESAPDTEADHSDDDLDEEDAGATTAPSSTDGRGGNPATEVSGVGPAFARRLRDAGVETIADLALSDPERLAERTDIARGRVETLVERARAVVEG